MTVLTIQNLTKVYGRYKAVDNLSLEIEKGKAFGLLGPNGSGKTTTLSMVLGVANSTSGSYQWFDGEKEVIARRKVGAILEQPVFYPSLSAVQNLRIVAHIKHIKNPHIEETLDFVGLLQRKDDKFKTYSLGMKQRLAIASAMLADPEVLILDEPTNGLDPEGIADIRQMIQQITQSGKTLILASHLLDEVQKICSDFIILNKGKTLYRGNVEEDLNTKGQYTIGSSKIENLELICSQNEFFKSWERIDNQIRIAVDEETDPSKINQLFFDKGEVLSELTPVKSRLEEKFLEILNQQ